MKYTKSSIPLATSTNNDLFRIKQALNCNPDYTFQKKRVEELSPIYLTPFSVLYSTLLQGMSGIIGTSISSFLFTHDLETIVQGGCLGATIGFISGLVSGKVLKNAYIGSYNKKIEKERIQKQQSSTISNFLDDISL
tara:strand:+ start:60 stop:470 length:411 start_codon:yes stop_codon:yes gene_type:complete